MHSDIFDSGNKTIVDCAHVKVERLDTVPVLFSKVFKEVQDQQGQRYDYRYWAERENFFLREFLKKKNEFTRVVQPRHLISENEAAKQVLTCDAGITIANWLRVRPRYADGRTLSHPFQRVDAFLLMLRTCLVALKQIHQHRIVHCDIKEDNICVPFSPYPYAGNGRGITIDFAGLKLIDFAFSISHAMPLTQILIINPDDKAPYQSPRLIAALKADRSSGSPNAVQHLDYRVDLFSLGYMAGKIVDGGLDCPAGEHGARILEGVRELIRELQSYDAAADDVPSPHDELLAQADVLARACEGYAGFMEFQVAGEWTADEMQKGQAAARKTPLTPVAPPVPTPVALPLALSLAPPLSLSPSPPFAKAADIEPRAPWRAMLVPSKMAWGIALGIALSLGLTIVGNPDFVRRLSAVTASAASSQTAGPAAPMTAQDKFAAALVRLAKPLRGDDDQAFQTAANELASTLSSGKPAAAALAVAIANENGNVLESQESRAIRARAWNRLKWMAGAGVGVAATRVAAFEKSYDETKQKIAASPWWVQGAGAPPDDAARWLENGSILAASGDRPAMLDQAYAEGYGRALALDRATAVESYLKVIARAEAGDEISGRIRLAAGHGLAAMLNAVVEQKDQSAAKTLQPVLESKANAGAADMQYYLGLFDECVTRPANLAAAKYWYQRSEADPAWKPTAEKKLALIGRWCPSRAN
jgi:hypothetical protein